MNDYTFKDSKYFDIFVQHRKTGATKTYRMCQNLNVAYNNLCGTYIFAFLWNKTYLQFDTKDSIITIH